MRELKGIDGPGFGEGKTYEENEEGLSMVWEIDVILDAEGGYGFRDCEKYLMMALTIGAMDISLTRHSRKAVFVLEKQE